jgi:histidinol-phosphatase (PHP family)
MMIKWDGHTHTLFCYHGSDAQLTEYIDRAIDLGFTRYSVTEHPPLPEGWVQDEKLMTELAMPMNQLSDYISYVQEMKRRYEGQIEITVGLEMDYLHESEAFSNKMLEPYKEIIEDVVVSVHYLPTDSGMYCIDYTADDFRQNLLNGYGSMNSVAEAYFDHVEKAINWAASLPMRKRLGHPLLIEKFSRMLPEISESLIRRRLEGIVGLLQTSGVGVDVNTAGLRVPSNGKAYAPEWFIRACQAQGIELVYGSDSHKPEQVGFGWDWFQSVREGNEPEFADRS